ncbi:prepilin peptidase [Rickettsiales endosymbiont of Stachyamoeba lipophora]|uniref:prepilin peptidase n=1 Tax=Rickettsiales endosymbiont of Stachyamoeba lipophora TaxID=2486578 RepID=UPI000F64B1E6|nr:prepilin peptidase [Rickettsiales endosymbiont of Stachyamoeba lipophora]AZL15836.1 hypothetical protein EF513_04665 [Rickettsiales endosymbiont of Stachyamoeba lipophora]
MFETLLAVIFGIMLASYSSSVFYRLPRNIPLQGFGSKGLKPHCSLCKTPLKPYEYYSVLSWFFCGTTCNYCGAHIDSKFRIADSLVIFNSVYLHYYFGFGDEYLLLLLWSVGLIIIAAINFTGYTVPKVLYVSIVIIAIMLKLKCGYELINIIPFSVVGVIISFAFATTYLTKIINLSSENLLLIASLAVIKFNFWMIALMLSLILGGIANFKLLKKYINPYPYISSLIAIAGFILLLIEALQISGQI